MTKICHSTENEFYELEIKAWFELSNVQNPFYISSLDIIYLIF